jgi:hypothetical protein
MPRSLSVILSVIMLASATSALPAQSLKGSPAAMQRQHRIAREHDYTFLRTGADVRRFVDLGLLVPVRSNGDYTLASVSHPYARPALLTFIRRLGRQYRAACGERLVVTSLTRPTTAQPRNASDLSVHPAGMAVDLRTSRKAQCRSWLEKTLISLEKQGVLDATRERFPPHYHIALYPAPYLRYVQGLAPKNAARVAANIPAPAAKPGPAEVAVAVAASADDAATGEYVVHRGDTLWSLARRYGTSVDELKQMNNLTSARIAAGQVLSVPASAP